MDFSCGSRQLIFTRCENFLGSFSLGTCLASKLEWMVGCRMFVFFFFFLDGNSLETKNHIYQNTFKRAIDWPFFIWLYAPKTTKVCPPRLLWINVKTLVSPEEIPLWVTTPLLCCSATVAQTLTSHTRLVPLSWHVPRNKMHYRFLAWTLHNSVMHQLDYFHLCFYTVTHIQDVKGQTRIQEGNA